MTGREMIDELTRILRYDGQLVDIAPAERDATLRKFLTQGIRHVQRELRFPMLLHTVEVSAGQNVVDLERDAGIFIVEKLYWQTPTGGVELKLIHTEADRLIEAWNGLGGSSVSYYRATGGMIQLFPAPSTNGNLIVRGVKKIPLLTAAQDNTEIGDIPESAHFAAIYYAAYLYLQPYTELFQKAQFYYALATDIARRVRGDNAVYDTTALGEAINRWKVMPGG